MAKHKTAIIIGAGPAGLTAAYELLQKTKVRPLVLEASQDIGGISKTVRYKGNRIDIGGHRFFSKSDVVMDWWSKILPTQGLPLEDSQVAINYQGKTRKIKLDSSGPDPEKVDNVMLVRNRLSRIYYLKSFFDYPVTLNGQTIKNLGIIRIVRIGLSYMRARILPIKDEKSLEDFFINRFGRELYLTFFKDYTEKVWGISCKEISAEWGAQRIKGLSISKALGHALRSAFGRKGDSISQKQTETSLIERFLYPKFGPGQMWEVVAEKVEQAGGQIIFNREVVGLEVKGSRVTGVKVKSPKSGKTAVVSADYYFSTMPVKDLVAGIEGEKVPPKVQKVAGGLMYRDFITVGLLLKKLAIKDSGGNLIPDNWIYIQEREVKVGRLQIFNNWSPYLIKDPSTVWIGMEYFVNEGDEVWSMSDAKMKQFAIKELSSIGIIKPNDVLDSVVIKVKKTYPAYFGTYSQFGVVRKYLDNFENLFLVGRNGMHKYNNQDHSMLSAMAAVENISKGIKTKDNIWQINVEQEYHESK